MEATFAASAEASKSPADLVDEAPRAMPEQREPRERRRYPRRERDDREDAGPAPGTREPAEQLFDEEPSDDSATGAEEPFGDEAATAAEGETAPASEPSPRRRRRRGDRKKRKRADGKGDAPLAAESPEVVSEQSGDEHDDRTDDDETDDGAKGGKAVFRGIPTWQEAIGEVVSANLAARARRPNGPSRGPRGGRGNRENRGGRSNG